MRSSAMFVAAILLQAGFSSALLHSAVGQSSDTGYAYVTMSMVRKYMPPHSFKNTMNEQELEEEATNIFDADRAAHEIKTHKQYMLKSSAEQEEALDGSESDRDPARQIARLANQLLKVESKYKLVVLTNDEALMNMSASELPANVVLHPVKDYLPRKCALAAKNTMHFQKLNVFGLTEYKKLMWMDWDLEIRKNVDDLFQRDTAGGKVIYGQKDDWQCTGRTGGSASGGFCSGMMLFTPLKSTLSNLVENQGKTCWGDQQLIAQQFDRKKTAETGREWRTWETDIIAFGPCAKKTNRVIHRANLPNSNPGKQWQ